MPAGTETTKAELSELVSLLRRYVVQETVGPLKSVARTLAFGAAAAVLFGIGGVLLLVGLLRVLQTETGTVFAGGWSWAPYFLTLVAAVMALGGAGAVIWRSGRTSSS